LIHFIGVLRTVTRLGCKRKFGHAVIKLLLAWLRSAALCLGYYWLRSSHFARDGGPDVLAVAAVCAFCPCVAGLSMGILAGLALFCWQLLPSLGLRSRKVFFSLQNFGQVGRLLQLVGVLLVERTLSLQVFFADLQRLRRIR